MKEAKTCDNCNRCGSEFCLNCTRDELPDNISGMNVHIMRHCAWEEQTDNWSKKNIDKIEEDE